MSDSEYYDILGVTRDAETAAIKKAYRKAAIRHHPDKNPGDTEAETQFKQAAEAYAVLSDPEKRRRYDQFGKAGVGAASGAAGFNSDIFSDFSDILGDLFGGGRGFSGSQRGRRVQVGRDLRFDLEIDFEEAVRGLETQIQVPTLEPCDDCDGSGANPGGVKTCSQCKGAGQVAFQQGFFTIARPCSQCSGVGQRITDPCETCDGGGQIQSQKELTIRLPAGVDEGTQLRMNGHGEKPRGGGPAGDLYVVVHVREHEQFRRDGLNLFLDVPLSFARLALGTEIEVLTLEGVETLRIPPGTPSGESFRLRNLGVPSLQGRRRGDQIVTVHVHVPKRLTDQQRELLEQLSEVEGEAVLEHGLFERVKNIFS